MPGILPLSRRIVMESGRAVITDKCVECGACVDSCGTGAIEFEETKETGPTLSSTRRMGFRGKPKKRIANVALELLGEGRKLAEQLGQELAAVLIGFDVEELAKECFAYGADRVYLVEGHAFANYSTGPYTAAFSQLIEKYKPNIVLFGATHDGRDFAARIAVRIYTGLTADCTELSIDPETGLCARPGRPSGERHGHHPDAQPQAADGHRAAQCHEKAGAGLPKNR